MHLNTRTEIEQEAYYAEMRRQAAAHRRKRELLGTKKPLYRRVLAGFGRLLVALGRRLVAERAAEKAAPQAPVVPVAKPARMSR